MARVADLPRIRRARIALDKLAADNPERCQRIGRWDEQNTREIIMTPVRERSRAYRSRMKEKGWKQTNVYLSPDAQERLKELQQQYPAQSIGELVSAALVADQRSVDRVIHPTADYQRENPVEERPHDPPR